MTCPLKSLLSLIQRQQAWSVIALIIGVSISSCDSNDDVVNTKPDTPSQVIYLESKVATEGQNAILAYTFTENGALTPLAGSPFFTGGKGVTNTQQILEPNDSDAPLVTSPDDKRLFAVNSGGNTIAVFDISTNGALTPVAGSPFPSRGNNPVSAGMAGNHLYVVGE